MRIERDESVDQGCKRAVDERLVEAAALARDRTLDADERVHEVRLCLKRARAAVALVAVDVGKPARRADHELREIARALGPLRDRVVAREALAALVRKLGRRGASVVGPSSPLGRSLGRALETRSAEARLAKAAVALDRVPRAVGRWRVARGRRAASDGVEDAYRRARRAYRRARKSDDFSLFHGWRKAVKRLDYQASLLERRAPALRESEPRLKRLAGMLGELHDLAVLRDVIERVAREVSDGGGRDALLGALDERAGLLRRDARALGAALFAERPSAVGQRVRASWVRTDA
jgi:CHAD domain-containing protein